MAQIDYSDERVITLLECIGIPYHWGAGDLTNAEWHADGYDCSGFAQAALVRLGFVGRDAWHDKSANDLAYVCDAVEYGDEQPGDLVFYRGGKKITHVCVALGGGMCIGANGGGSKTKGDNEKACVQVRPIKYRGDYLCSGRIKKQYRRVGG